MNVEVIVAIGGFGVMIVGAFAGRFASHWEMKGKSEIFVTHPQHREICHNKSVEMYDEIKTNHQTVMDKLQEISEKIGYIKGIQNGGSL